MKSIYVEDIAGLKPEQMLVSEDFYLSDIQLSTGKSGTARYDAILEDKTGKLVGKLWREFWTESSEVMNSYVGNVVRVNAVVDVYQGMNVLKITSMTLAPNEEVDMAEYTRMLPVSLREKYKERMELVINSVAEPMRNLLEVAFMGKRFEEFSSIPAHLSQHHVFNGGLLVKTLEALDIAIAAAETSNRYGEVKSYLYKEVDVDLVVAGTLLCCLGKISEYSPLPCKTRKARGQLINYSTESVNLVTYLNASLPKEKKLLSTSELAHIILASSGDVVPATKEAMIVSYAMQMVKLVDSYDTCISAYQQKYPGNTVEFVYNRLTESNVYLGENKSKEEK